MFHWLSTCQSSGMISSSRNLKKKMRIGQKSITCRSKVSPVNPQGWSPPRGCLQSACCCCLSSPPCPPSAGGWTVWEEVALYKVQGKSLTLVHGNLQDFPHFLSSGRTLNSWNRLLPHLILYLVHFVQCSYETKCICDQTRCQGTRALWFTPPRAWRDMLRKGPRDRTRGRIKRKNRDKRKEKGTREETRALNFMPPLLISKLIERAERQTKIVL